MGYEDELTNFIEDEPRGKFEMVKFSAKVGTVAKPRETHTNEDAYYVSESFAVLADGMGGHAAGDVASSLAVEAVKLEFSDLEGEGARAGIDLDVLKRRLANAVTRAHTQIVRDAEANSEREDMGTTLLITVTVKDPTTNKIIAVTASIGDSRAYKLKIDGRLEVITLDHVGGRSETYSDLSEQDRRDAFKEQEYFSSDASTSDRLFHSYLQNRNGICYAVGLPNPKVDIYETELLPGEKLCLATDGVTDPLTTEQMEKCLAGHPTDDTEAINSLLRLAGDPTFTGPRQKPDDRTFIICSPNDFQFETKPNESIPLTFIEALNSIDHPITSILEVRDVLLQMHESGFWKLQFYINEVPDGEPRTIAEIMRSIQRIINVSEEIGNAGSESVRNALAQQYEDELKMLPLGIFIPTSPDHPVFGLRGLVKRCLDNLLMGK